MTAETASLPDARGMFGQFGGRFVPETLVPALIELEEAYARWSVDPVSVHQQQPNAIGVTGQFNRIRSS